MTTLNAQPHALYRFFDSEGELLYVGITNDPGRRWSDHRRQKSWWHEVANVTIEKYDSRAGVLRAEAAAIAAEGPRYNIAGMPRAAIEWDESEDMSVIWDSEQHGTVLSVFVIGGELLVLFQSQSIGVTIPAEFVEEIARTLSWHRDDEHGTPLVVSVRPGTPAEECVQRFFSSRGWKPCGTSQVRLKGLAKIAVSSDLMGELDAVCDDFDRPMTNPRNPDPDPREVRAGEPEEAL